MKLWFSFRLIDAPFAALGINTSPSSVIIERHRVIWVSPEAEAAGAEIGMDITTAQTLSDCEFVERDRALEEEFLQRQAEALYVITPHITFITSTTVTHLGLTLEVSTCLQLFGGAKAIQEQALQIFANGQHRVEFGMAHTAEAAWLLTYADAEYSFHESKDDFIHLLNQLPVELLYEFPKQVEALEKTGFFILGDIAHQIERQSIAGIRKRFGQAFTDYLCRMFGIDLDFQQGSLFSVPVATYKPAEHFSTFVQFEYPTSSTALMEWPVENLLQKLSDYLRKNQLETQHIEWTLSDIYKTHEYIKVFADIPQSHWELFYDLTMIQLEHRQFSFEVDILTLTCEHTARLQSRGQVLNFDLARRSRNLNQDFSITAAKLKARLGDDAVYKLSYKRAIAPELSQEKIPLATPCNQEVPEELTDVPRPTWLIPDPVPIEERKKGLYWRGYLNLGTGPERIHGDWLGTTIARDYFVATRHDHVRLWVFKDLKTKTWFVHGIFG
ncbi:nucleotidyltransferase [Cellvibrio zantedeschiae]|uniref:Nucleotidyltransferase n=1 Tax=Cellvibrio zantedeschiae TaxID=1237077 RepID=A0ABQ3B904_9GAMM|nr:DNA polymerase Y family protein [Cellvibrio zantedeschiae]GGY79255.1 nucleotidyltransferase [Cellvibrio zantedeschiae]